MRCNINSKGKAVRLVLGAAVMTGGALTLVLIGLGASQEAWLIVAGIALLVAGAFAIFEGWAGWCVLRAMGVRTRI
jgi:predicted lysophospholipase L1 biosynthesis ABC-type transport system permease subunit